MFLLVFQVHGLITTCVQDHGDSDRQSGMSEQDALRCMPGIDGLQCANLNLICGDFFSFGVLLI